MCYQEILTHLTIFTHLLVLMVLCMNSSEWYEPGYISNTVMYCSGSEFGPPDCPPVPCPVLRWEESQRRRKTQDTSSDSGEIWHVWKCHCGQEFDLWKVLLGGGGGKQTWLGPGCGTRSGKAQRQDFSKPQRRLLGDCPLRDGKIRCSDSTTYQPVSQGETQESGHVCGLHGRSGVILQRDS